MQLGFALPVAGAWATPENQIRLAQAAEACGYHSLWTLQRLLYPVQPQTAWAPAHRRPSESPSSEEDEHPPAAGQPWPAMMERVQDPVVPLAFVAGVTQRIRLGTAVLIMPYYTPVLLAKQLATLDIVCGGRLDVGLGIGWSMDEYAAVGVPFRDRGRRGDEFLRCLRALWTEDPVEFSGRYYQVPRSHVEPKPVQRPHPPLLIGGYGSAAVRRAATLGDGFIGGGVPLAEVRADIERYAEAGLTELFLDPNIDPTGSLRALEPSTALEQVLTLLTALAPGSS